MSWSDTLSNLTNALLPAVIQGGASYLNTKDPSGISGGILSNVAQNMMRPRQQQYAPQQQYGPSPYDPSPYGPSPYGPPPYGQFSPPQGPPPNPFPEGYANLPQPLPPLPPVPQQQTAYPPTYPLPQQGGVGVLPKPPIGRPTESVYLPTPTPEPTPPTTSVTTPRRRRGPVY